MLTKLIYCKKCNKKKLQVPVKNTDNIYQCLCGEYNWHEKSNDEAPDKNAGQTEEINE
jgi:hypothetical protein